MKRALFKRAFTLIELLLAMALLGILVVLLVGNFSTTLKRGRDQQRKNDLNQVQRALDLYFEENQAYPTFNIIAPNASRKFCTSESCSPGETVYMTKVPADPSSIYKYTYVPEAVAAPTYYYLYSYIENSQDTGNGVSITGYTTGIKCDVGNSANCRYYVGSSNATPLTPN